MPRDLKAAITEAQERLEDAHGAQATERVRQRLRGGSRRPRRVRWGRVAGAAAVVALAVVVAGSMREQERTLGRYVVLEGGLSGAVEGAVLTIRDGHGVLRDGALGADLEVSAAASLRPLDDGLEVVAGKVSLDVDHAHPRAAPFRVRVSHGLIEVLGTRFIVVQGELGGEVTLLRGSIRFLADDGQRRLLEPGETLRWPLPPVAAAIEAPAPAPKPAPAPSTPPRTPRPTAAPVKEALGTPPFDVAQFIDELALLRSRGAYEEAVARLTRTLAEGHAPATDERLSFELGSLLGRQLRDAERACAHWREHLRRFPQGRYQADVTQARAELGCP
ncbi:MAG: FecR domain-containing protein [Myxococcaceae bacterium]|nr:FecR domain-containing protein [Myxococcaceae bacterium]